MNNLGSLHEEYIENDDTESEKTEIEKESLDGKESSNQVNYIKNET